MKTVINELLDRTKLILRFPFLKRFWKLPMYISFLRRIGAMNEETSPTLTHVLNIYHAFGFATDMDDLVIVPTKEKHSKLRKEKYRRNDE